MNVAKLASQSLHRPPPPGPFGLASLDREIGTVEQGPSGVIGRVSVPAEWPLEETSDLVGCAWLQFTELASNSPQLHADARGQYLSRAEVHDMGPAIRSAPLLQSGNA